MKKQITQVLQEFSFQKGLCIFRKCNPNSYWCDALEKESDREYAEKKLKELLERIL